MRVRWNWLYLITLLFIISGCAPAEYDEKVIQEHNGFRLAQNVTDEFQVGWSLGNTLDSFDLKKYNLAKSDYQIQSVYSNKNWDGWDASDAPYIGNEGNINFQWTIDTLNSSLDGEVGSFSLQLINHVVGSTGGEYLYVEIDSAQFETLSGEVIQLKEFEKIHKLSIEEGVSDYISADLSMTPVLDIGGDVLGGTLMIQGSIERYPEIKGMDLFNVERYETYWGNPVTTQEMIHEVASAGFQGIRVPVTYYDHLGEELRIDEAWLNRVQEVVDMVISEDMYCINLHHDSAENALLYASLDDIEDQKKIINRLWFQIANRFEDYGDLLMFEGFNEILNKEGDWGSQSKEDLEAVNLLNQTFVDTIRESGGNNLYRNLIVKTYAAGHEDYIFDNFVMPEDEVEDHLIVGVHFYLNDPYKSYEAGQFLMNLGERFKMNEIPVIITEFATFNDWTRKESLEFVDSFFSKLKMTRIPVLWWDRGGEQIIEYRDTLSLLDRKGLVWYYEDLMEKIFD